MVKLVRSRRLNAEKTMRSTGRRAVWLPDLLNGRVAHDPSERMPVCLQRYSCPVIVSRTTC